MSLGPSPVSATHPMLLTSLFSPHTHYTPFGYTVTCHFSLALTSPRPNPVPSPTSLPGPPGGRNQLLQCDIPRRVSVTHAHLLMVAGKMAARCSSRWFAVAVSGVRGQLVPGGHRWSRAEGAQLLALRVVGARVLAGGEWKAVSALGYPCVRHAQGYIACCRS